MEREIWFEKWLWSYMPCHWKGVAALFAVIALTLAAMSSSGMPSAMWTGWKFRSSSLACLRCI